MMYGSYNYSPMNPYQMVQPGQSLGMQYPSNMQYMGAVQNQSQPQAQALQVLKGRPVSNFDEANASMIDLDGSLFIFPDISNNFIYTKQIMLDGKPELKTYKLVEQKSEGNDTLAKDEYVLKSDYDKAIKKLETKINKLIKGGKVSESNANVSKYDDTEVEG